MEELIYFYTHWKHISEVKFGDDSQSGNSINKNETDVSYSFENFLNNGTLRHRRFVTNVLSLPIKKQSKWDK